MGSLSYTAPTVEFETRKSLPAKVTYLQDTSNREYQVNFSYSKKECQTSNKLQQFITQSLQLLDRKPHHHLLFEYKKLSKMGQFLLS